ncbi:MAG: hypothetical protein DRI84_03250 [Bacteroidetes bacterium]|nr:MAG: hypothetical protein DRI84_03250 [Bacteroidota bacterium]
MQKDKKYMMLLSASSLRRILVFVLLHFYMIVGLHAQVIGETSLYITTDRNLYVTGEQISFRVFDFTQNKGEVNTTFVYCDLIGQDGIFYKGIKAKLRNQNLSLQMIIPEHLHSGNYLLRAYTRKMQSHYPWIIAMHSIKIVNPKVVELLPIQREGELKLQIDTLIRIGGAHLENIAQKYPKRALIACSLHLTDSNIILPSLSVSVVPKESFSTYILVADDLNSEFAVTDEYVVEGNGLIISGRLNDKSLSHTKNLSGRRIYFSIRGSKDVFSSITDSVGRFQTKLPNIYGSREIYLTTERMDGDLIIKINRDFDSHASIQFNQEFVLSKDELELALQLAQNQSIIQSYMDSVRLDTLRKHVRPFYDKPDEVIVIRDYIDLADLSKYFTELPGNVHLNKRNGVFEMRIFNPDDMQLFNAPLIMVDYVVVNDLESVLRMNPKGINRIEIVRDYYQKGDASFGGIINFISNKNDFGGYEFPNSSVSITYDFLTKYQKDTTIIPSSNKPDARNTLFWKTNLKPKGNKVDLSFYTSDTPGIYSIVVQGVNQNGVKIYYSKDFIVE